jgi:hypothetical protein
MGALVVDEFVQRGGNNFNYNDDDFIYAFEHCRKNYDTFFEAIRRMQ